MMLRRALVSSSFLAALCAAPAVARAQRFEDDVRYPTAPPVVPVHFVGDDHTLRYEVYEARAVVGRDDPIARCAGKCSVFLRPGKYRLRLENTPEETGGERVFKVKESSRVRVAPRSRDEAYLGLAVGIAGSVAVATAFVLLIPTLFASCETADSCDNAQTRKTIGLLLFGAGAVATPVGWVAFGQNIRTRADVEPIRRDDAAKGARHRALSAQPFGVSASFSF